MESIEGYSYYDTPAGPQYIRNDSLDLTTTPVESRQRNSPSTSSINIKFHPYPQRRRADRNGTSLVSDHVHTELNSCHDKGLQRFGISNCNESTLPIEGSFEANNDANAYVGPVNATYTDSLLAINQPGDKAYISPAFTTTIPAHRAELVNARCQVRRERNHQIRSSMLPLATSAPLDDFSRPTVDINDGAIKQWLDQSWYHPSQANALEAPTDMPTEFWPIANISSEPLARIRDESTTSHLSSQEIRTPMSTETIAHHEPVSPKNSVLCDITQEGTSMAFSLLNADNFVHGHGASVLDIPIDEALFEYGPFFDFDGHPNQALGNENLWSSSSQPQIGDHVSPKQVTQMMLVSPVEEQDRPIPQVALVGGYFAPEDDNAIPAPPEVNSQGNIRISRLPPKRAPIAYEIPAIPDMTVSQLKSELKRYGLQAVGKKSELQARLEAHLGHGHLEAKWSG